MVALYLVFFFFGTFQGTRIQGCNVLWYLVSSQYPDSIYTAQLKFVRVARAEPKPAFAGKNYQDTMQAKHAMIVLLQVFVGGG